MSSVSLAGVAPGGDLPGEHVLSKDKQTNGTSPAVAHVCGTIPAVGHVCTYQEEVMGGQPSYCWTLVGEKGGGKASPGIRVRRHGVL